MIIKRKVKINKRIVWKNRFRKMLMERIVKKIVYI